MAVIRVEPEPEVKQDTCERCGGVAWLILGYVYADDEPHGIYYVDWCEGPHEDRFAFVTLSLGRFDDEEATGADRLAVGVETRCDGMRLADRPFRDRPDFLGRFVPRDEVLRLGHVDGIWHVCDHLVDDPRFTGVTAWLCGERQSALGPGAGEPSAPPD